MTLILIELYPLFLAAELAAAACIIFFQKGALCRELNERFCRMDTDPCGSTPRYIRRRNLILGEHLDALFIEYTEESDTKEFGRYCRVLCVFYCSICLACDLIFVGWTVYQIPWRCRGSPFGPCQEIWKIM